MTIMHLYHTAVLSLYKNSSVYKCSIICTVVEYNCTCNQFIPNCGYLCWCLGKNASFLRVVRCRSLAEEYSVDSVNKDEISEL